MCLEYTVFPRTVVSDIFLMLRLYKIRFKLFIETTCVYTPLHVLTFNIFIVKRSLRHVCSYI